MGWVALLARGVSLYMPYMQHVGYLTHCIYMHAVHMVAHTLCRTCTWHLTHCIFMHAVSFRLVLALETCTPDCHL